MRKIIVSEFVSLDGVMEEPAWTAPYWNGEIAKFKFDELFASGALLLGRVTYQGFAAAWPSRTDEQGYADRMNSLPKFVVSTTLQKAEWNDSRLIKENVAEEVSKLKQQPGQDILLFGSGTLAQTLMQHDLVDQYNLLLYPVVLGKGKRLFRDGNIATLKLVETKTFSSGVVALVYRPDKKIDSAVQTYALATGTK
jgi:dihydrofolate reductase